MPKPVLFAMSAAAMALTMYAATVSPIGTVSALGAPGTRVPLTPKRRNCDSSLMVNNFWGTMPAGYGEVLIRTSGNTVVAEVQFVNSRFPGAHYDVGLIQAPRPASMPCGPGAPDTVFTGMDVDGAGRATATLSDTIRPGTTGVWVQMQRPAAHSQDPTESYTSSYVAHV